MTEIQENPTQKEGETKLQFKKCIVALVGPPLTGKTALGRELERRSNFTFFDVDSVRLDIFPSTTEMLPDLPEQGQMLYSYWTAHEKRAKPLLERGEPVILASTFSRKRWHILLKRLAQQTNAPLRVFYLDAPDDVIKQRIEQRQTDNPGLVRNIEQFLAIKGRYKLIEDVDLVKIDTSEPFDKTLERVLNSLEDLRVES